MCSRALFDQIAPLLHTRRAGGCRGRCRAAPAVPHLRSGAAGQQAGVGMMSTQRAALHERSTPCSHPHVRPSGFWRSTARRLTPHACAHRHPQDINSPFRHVRTRIYFTSESHMHSLLNVLRFSHMGEWGWLAWRGEGEGAVGGGSGRAACSCMDTGPLCMAGGAPPNAAPAIHLTAAAPRSPTTGNEGEEPLLGADGLRVLRACEELDYMTHIVLRMFENMM